MRSFTIVGTTPTQSVHLEVFSGCPLGGDRRRSQVVAESGLPGGWHAAVGESVKRGGPGRMFPDGVLVGPTHNLRKIPRAGGGFQASTE